MDGCCQFILKFKGLVVDNNQTNLDLAIGR